MTTTPPASESSALTPMWSDDAIINLLTRDPATFRLLVRLRNDYEAARAVAANTMAAQEARIAELQAIIAYIDKHAPLADMTCAEPGITLSEAARRAIEDEGGVGDGE